MKTPILLSFIIIIWVNRAAIGHMKFCILVIVKAICINKILSKTMKSHCNSSGFNFKAKSESVYAQRLVDDNHLLMGNCRFNSTNILDV